MNVSSRHDYRDSASACRFRNPDSTRKNDYDLENDSDDYKIVFFTAFECTR